MRERDSECGMTVDKMHIHKCERHLLPGPELLSPLLYLLAVLLVQLLKLLGLVFDQKVTFLIL